MIFLIITYVKNIVTIILVFKKRLVTRDLEFKTKRKCYLLTIITNFREGLGRQKTIVLERKTILVQTIIHLIFRKVLI